jgi:hypothetical protein
MSKITRRMFTALFSASVLVGWTHGGGQIPGSNVVDDFGVLVVDDSAIQVVTS